MISGFGVACVAIGAIAAAYAVGGSFFGERYRISALRVSARWGFYASAAAALIASITLVIAFVTNQFQIEYVFNHSSSVMSRALIWVAFYAGNEGSLLFIASALGVMSLIAVRFMPKSMLPARVYVIMILGGLQVFYLGLILLFANPFDVSNAPIAATEGRGLNPLLRHPGMFIHPPLLMTGLIGISIPFALINGALLARVDRDAWVDGARVWGVVIWAFLGVGMLLGAWWAYTILGWGGYWSWDPIENVALMPWLALTAFIHSVMVQKRRGMFRAWNVALIGVAFVLAQLGTSINRGGTVVSVHSFAESTLGTIFLGFMIFSALFALALFLRFWLRERTERRLESFFSREVAILINTFMLLVATVVILWGVIFPVFTNLSSEVEISIAAPYFNRVVGPIFLATLFLMGIGPLLPWRRTTRQFLARWFAPSLAISLATVALIAILGVRSPLPLLIFGVLTFSLMAVLIEWWRGVRARMRAGSKPWSAWWNMVSENRQRHGGYVVHIAMLIFALGVAGTQFFDIRTDASLAEGESVILRDFRFEYARLNQAAFPDRVEEWADINVYQVDRADYAAAIASGDPTSNGVKITAGAASPNDVLVGQLEPWQGFYPLYNQVSVRSGIHSTPAQDLYIVPRDFTQDELVVLGISINPLAMWLWIAGPVFLAGTTVALWPSRRPHKPPTKEKAS